MLQFQSFLSSPDISFWHEYARRKLEIYKLSEDPVDVFGYFSNDNAHNQLPARISLHNSSFEDNPPSPFQFRAPGTLYITNTIESFKSKDKKQLFNDVANQIWKDITTGRALEDPSLLNRFLVLSHGDLKKYRFHYWFAFPALNFPDPLEATKTTPLFDVLSDSQRQELKESYATLRGYGDDSTQRTDEFAFLIIKSGDSIRAEKLCEWEQFVDESVEISIGMSDPSGSIGHAGWPARNLAILISVQMKKLLHKPIQMFFLRQWRKDFDESSFVVSLQLHPEWLGEDCPKSVGWEKDSKQKLRPKFIELGSTMDPKQLAESQTSLNLQLMKWRLMPSLDLDKIANTKCLLVGSGTLGCNVARCLISWGVRNITFIDNGTVSFSNPVRQSLFTFEDCLNGGKPKALAAADALKSIFPSVNATGIQLSVPMPGHSVPENMIPQVRETIQQFDRLVEESDVVFQLTDSREARWLPSVLCAAKDKICINAALGFDTFLSMRHGCSPLVGMKEGGTRLGCYFCNDITGPSDSLRNRSLDQQCTVTRPGVSMLAASCAVEIMVLVLQHSLGNQAPADVSNDITSTTSTPLGIVPHQIRGFLSHFNNVLTEAYSYDKCTACSKVVVSYYKENGEDLVFRAMNTPSFLEDITGLTELLNDTTNECLSWDEEDLE